MVQYSQCLQDCLDFFSLSWITLSLIAILTLISEKTVQFMWSLASCHLIKQVQLRNLSREICDNVSKNLNNLQWASLCQRSWPQTKKWDSPNFTDQEKQVNECKALQIKGWLGKQAANVFSLIKKQQIFFHLVLLVKQREC
jgi:hypothetical protein